MRIFLRKTFLLTFAFIGIAVPVMAQVITIGNGTGSTTSQPIGTFYNYSASEMIYLASEIGQAVNITGIAFDKASGSSTQEVNDVFIYMKMTTASNYGTGVTQFTTSLDGYTLVWSGNFPNSGTGWQGVTLNTPFQYSDATKNLAVFIVNNSGAAIASGRPQYRYTTTSPTKQNGNFGSLGNTLPWAPTSQFTPVWERANVRFNTGAIAGCINPSGLSARYITPNSATLLWTGHAGNSPAGYDWEVRLTGEGGSGTTGLVAFGNTTGSTDTASVTSLTAATNYKLYVRAKCVAGSASSWTGPYDFTTACNIYSLPFAEGFNSNIRPSCWSQDHVAGLFSIDFTYPPTGTTPAATAFEGSNFVLFSSNTITAGGKMRLVSPAIKTQGVNSVDVEFEFYHSRELPNYPDSLTLQYSLDGNNWTDVIDGNVVRQNDVEGWAHKTITLPQEAANQSKIYIGFLFKSAFGYNCYIDDVLVKASAVTCRPPANVTVTSVSSAGATISWTAPAIVPANGYEWKIVNANAGAEGVPVLSGTTSEVFVTVSGLSAASQTYAVYVRSVCESSNSLWSSVTNFSTPCAEFPLPFKEDFSSYTAQFPPNCWTSSNNTFIKGSDAGAFNTGNGSLLFNNFLATHGSYDMTLPVTAATTEGYQLIFNYACAAYALGDYQDGLIIYYSTDGGLTYTPLVSYTGSKDGTLNTARERSYFFIPNSAEWGIKYISLPVGTNRIKFTGVCSGGNNLFIDNVEIKIPGNRISISPNPANNYIIVRGIDMTDATLVIRDVSGRTVLSVKGRSVIDISKLPSAIYAASIYSASGRFTQKLVVIK